MDAKTKRYDAIVVYSESIANSAGNYKEKAPFSSKSDYGIYNDSYSYFLLKCKKLGINAAFATSKDIIGPGLFQSCWTYDKRWVRNRSRACSGIIFDKFTPASVSQKNKLELLTSSKQIYTFNNKKMVDIFQNKLNTYKNFKKFAIPSIKIANPSKRVIILAKNKLEKLLKKHRYKADFSSGFIIKDTTGAGGFKIHKINFDKEGLKKIIKHHKSDKKNKESLSYILQPFINCNHGFGKYSRPIDLRLILLNHKIVQVYMRIAKKGNFKCNYHQGGSLVYRPQKTIPKKVLTMTKKIIKILDSKLSLKHNLYSLDFIQSNNGNLYFIEGNTNPGINWLYKKEMDKIKAKELINIIVSELKSIIQEKK